ncbi:hypothetical protein L1887_38167 [Cichorium endivia]|nr:hypothetical protein L1887_38167 [Cichorium endivia]
MYANANIEQGNIMAGGVDATGPSKRAEADEPTVEGVVSPVTSGDAGKQFENYINFNRNSTLTSAKP